jgi:hypothetical protein
MTSRVLAVASLLGTALVVCAPGPAMSQSPSKPDSDNGRYSLSPSSDGFVRLDNRTGAISNCTNKGSGWACYSTPDERATMDSEIGRLQSENARLKADLARRDSAAAAPGGKTDEPLAKSDSEKPAKAADNNSADAKVADKAPSHEDPIASKPDHDVGVTDPQSSGEHRLDRIRAFFETAWRRLVEMAGRIRGDASASDTAGL